MNVPGTNRVTARALYSTLLYYKAFCGFKQHQGDQFALSSKWSDRQQSWHKGLKVAVATYEPCCVYSSRFNSSFRVSLTSHAYHNFLFNTDRLKGAANRLLGSTPRIMATFFIRSVIAKIRKDWRERSLVVIEPFEKDVRSFSVLRKEKSTGSVITAWRLSFENMCLLQTISFSVWNKRPLRNAWEPPLASTDLMLTRIKWG